MAFRSWRQFRADFGITVNKASHFFQLAKTKAKCDFALYFGAAATNAPLIPALSPRAAGLKMYLNDTYTTLKMDDVTLWMEVGT